MVDVNVEPKVIIMVVFVAELSSVAEESIGALVSLSSLSLWSSVLIKQVVFLCIVNYPVFLAASSGLLEFSPPLTSILSKGGGDTL